MFLNIIFIYKIGNPNVYIRVKHHTCESSIPGFFCIAKNELPRFSKNFKPYNSSNISVFYNFKSIVMTIAIGREGIWNLEDGEEGGAVIVIVPFTAIIS